MTTTKRHLIFLHGLASSVATWSKLQPSIQGNDTFWSFAIPGYGSSDPPSPQAKLSDLLKPFCSFLEDLDGNLVILGHSMGARYALMALASMGWRTSRHAKIEAFVIEDMDMEPHFFQKPTDVRAYYQGFSSLQALNDRLSRDGYREQKIQDLASSNQLYESMGRYSARTNPAVDDVYQSLILESNHVEIFGSIPNEVRVLLLQAGSGSLTSEKGLRNMKSARNFTHVQIPEATHNKHRSAEFEYLEAIRKFLAMRPTL